VVVSLRRGPERPFTLLFTVDLEEQARLERVGLARESMSVAAQGARDLIELLEGLGIKATWFTTATFALNEPRMVRELAQRGHEVALHGFHDRDDYKTMEPSRAGSLLFKANRVVGSVAGRSPIGFRAPRFQHPGHDLLAGLGLAYDSSLHPSPVPGRYSGRGPLEPFREPESDMTVLPVSVVPGVRLPLSWLWFRALPEGYTRWGASLVEANSDHLCLYFHPWDFADLRPYRFWLPPGYTWKTAGAVAKMQSFLEWGLGRGWKSSTVEDYLKQNDLI